MPASATPISTECFRPALASATDLSLLHVFPSFGIGGVPLRMCRVINYLGRRFRHTIIALDGKPVTSVSDLMRALDADKIDRTVSIDFLRRSEQLRLWIGPVERLLAA